MTQTTAQPGFTQEAFESLLADRNEPDWLRTQRQAAWDAFAGQQLPTRRDEEWMRTDIRRLRLDRFAPPTQAPAVDGPPPSALDAGVDLAGRSCSVDGHAQHVHLDPQLAAQGVVFGSLQQAVRDHAALVEPHLLTRAVDPHHDKFASLHAAFWTGGHFLYVPRGVAIEQPLHALSAMTDGSVDLGHILVVLDDGAEATLLTETASYDESHGGLHCGAIELIVGRGAHLRFVNLQDWGGDAWHFAHQKAVVGQDATLQWTIGALGARLAKVNQHVALAGPGSQCQVNGVMFTEGRQHLSYHTLQHHQAPGCRSDFLYKSALQDESRTVWRGMVKVDVDAQQTDGYQRNDNLLLSTDARADSIPGLEIEADDVACSHGSTTGRVDEEMIFYCRGRGFTRNEAMRMIVTGFFQQVFDRITIPSVREALGRAIARRVRDYA